MDGGDKPAFLERLNQAMIAAVPFNAALGLAAEDYGEGFSVIRLPYRAELVGNPVTGVIHGGMITSLIDAASGLAVFMRIKRVTRIATLDLRIDYLRPAEPTRDVRARAECYKAGKQVAFIRALAYHEDDKDPIASAAGTFMIFEDGRSPVGKALANDGK
jgi:uncharacterized protein (TIGR00369 family)